MVNFILSLVSEKSEFVIERFRNDTNNKSNKQTSNTKGQAEDVFNKRNRRASESLHSEIDKCVLNSKTDKHDYYKVSVAENIFERIKNIST